MVQGWEVCPPTSGVAFSAFFSVVTSRQSVDVAFPQMPV